MGLYMDHTAKLRSPETARMHALRTGPWMVGRASDARRVAAKMIADMSGKYAPATINRSLGAFKKGLHIAWESGYTATDYSAYVKRIPENNKRTTYPTLEQVRAIADKCGREIQAAIWLALLTGARRGEICKLTRADIGENEITIQSGNTKTLRTRTVPIVAAMRPWLEFIPLGVTFEGLKTGFRRARVLAELPKVRFHDLRHACASMLINADVPLEVVRDVLGHTSVKTTERYAHLNIAKQRQALELLGRITQEGTQGHAATLKKQSK